jgi:hypothetical protein
MLLEIRTMTLAEQRTARYAVQNTPSQANLVNY